MWCSKLKIILLVIILWLGWVIANVFTYQFEMMDDTLHAKHYEGKSDVVVLLHGIARSKESMGHIANALKFMDYDVINIYYPSTHYDIATLASMIDGYLQNALPNDKDYHMIGYSMGGLMIRQLVGEHGYTPKKVVMIGTPNHGSKVADAFKDWWLYQKVWGPAGQELTTDFSAIPPLPDDIELTVIAGATSATTAFGSLLPSPNDGTVSVESTKLGTMKQHFTVDATHYKLLTHPDMWAYVVAGLQL